MQTQTLHLPDVLTHQDIQDLSDLLILVLGVKKAVFQAGGKKVQISFDEEHISHLEIETAVARAGFRITRGRAEAVFCGG